MDSADAGATDSLPPRQLCPVAEGRGGGSRGAMAEDQTYDADDVMLHMPAN